MRVAITWTPTNGIPQTLYSQLSRTGLSALVHTLSENTSMEAVISIRTSLDPEGPESLRLFRMWRITSVQIDDDEEES